VGGGAGVGGRWRRGEEGSAAARGEEGFPVSPWMTMAMVGEAETFLRERKSRRCTGPTLCLLPCWAVDPMSL